MTPSFGVYMLYRVQEISSHPTACGPANNDKRFIALTSTPGGSWVGEVVAMSFHGVN